MDKSGFAKMLREIVSDMDEEDKDMDNSVNAHYGIGDTEFKSLVKEVIKTSIDANMLSDILDKTFPKLDANQRVRVFAFHVGLSFWEDFKKSGKHKFEL